MLALRLAADSSQGASVVCDGHHTLIGVELPTPTLLRADEVIE
jgi:hypothetical protein